MAMKYFNGDTELTRIQPMLRAEFASRFPGVVGKRCDSFSLYVGEPADGPEPIYDHAARRWNRTLLPVERSVAYRSNPSLHECDARCYNATGRTMQCECACGGKNHGKGAFNCTAA